MPAPAGGKRFRYNTPMKTQISRVLASRSDVLFGYLFGSYAEGTPSEYSDVDVAIYFTDEEIDTRLDLIHQLEKQLHKKIDLLDLNRTQNIYLLDTIIRKGIVVKDHPSRSRYELNKWQEINDFLETKRYIDAA